MDIEVSEKMIELAQELKDLMPWVDSVTVGYDQKGSIDVVFWYEDIGSCAASCPTVSDFLHYKENHPWKAEPEKTRGHFME